MLSTNYNCAHALERHLASIYAQFPVDEFEYVVVDNLSDDQSPEILAQWAASKENFRVIRKRCTMGLGREIAARNSRASHLLVVDTDTVYLPILRPFVERSVREWPKHSVQAIYAGVFPKPLWNLVGGRGNFNTGEDLDMWMRLWKLGKMRWYPVLMGENIKEERARDSFDHLSSRYTKVKRFQRLVRREFDLLRLARYETMDLDQIWRTNTVDFNLGPIQTEWFGKRRSGGISDRVVSFARLAWQVVQS